MNLLPIKVPDCLSEEPHLGEVFEWSACGMSLVSLSGKWIRVNQALCRLLGYSKEELVTRSFGELTHPDDLNEDVEKLHLLAAGAIEIFQREKRYLRKDGKVI